MCIRDRYKHVPLVELNQSEGVLNNVIGTLECAKASLDSNIETFVLISTDKAVRPTNTMGASKRVAELILQAFSKISQRAHYGVFFKQKTAYEIHERLVGSEMCIRDRP